MCNWFTNYWAGNRDFWRAFWVWGILANGFWHFGVVLGIAYFIGKKLLHMNLLIEIPPSVFAAMAFLLWAGLIQAFFFMLPSLKILFACRKNIQPSYVSSWVLFLYTPYALMSFVISFGMVVLMPIWWNN